MHVWFRAPPGVLRFMAEPPFNEEVRLNRARVQAAVCGEVFVGVWTAMLESFVCPGVRGTSVWARHGLGSRVDIDDCTPPGSFQGQGVFRG